MENKTPTSFKQRTFNLIDKSDQIRRDLETSNLYRYWVERGKSAEMMVKKAIESLKTDRTISNTSGQELAALKTEVSILKEKLACQTTNSLIAPSRTSKKDVNEKLSLLMNAKKLQGYSGMSLISCGIVCAALGSWSTAEAMQVSNKITQDQWDQSNIAERTKAIAHKTLQAMASRPGQIINFVKSKIQQ